MAAQAETNVVGLEIEKVRDKVKTLFDRDDKFFSSLEKKPVEEVSNRDMRIPLEFAPGGKFGQYNPDGGNLGRGGGIGYDKALINTVHFKHAVEFTSLSQWSTDSKRKAVLDSFRDALAKQLKEFRRNIDSMCMTDGTGVVATVSAVSAGGGLGGGDKLTLGTDGFGARLIRKFQNLNLFNAALSTNRTAGAEREVVFYDAANKIIDLAAPAITGSTATDKLVLSGATSTPPVSLLGVPYHHSNASTGTWLGFNRATAPEIRASRTNAAGPLALPFPRLAINKIGDRVGIDNGMKLQAWTHPCQAQAYEELGQMVSQINKAPKDEGLDLYFNDNMQMAGAPVKKSFSWDKTRIDLITDIWGRAELKEIDFFKSPQDGRKIFEVRGADGGVAAAWLFYLVVSFNIFVDNPAAGSYIDGLTVPAGY